MEEKINEILELIAQRSADLLKEYETVSQEPDSLHSQILLEKISLLDNLYNEVEIVKKSSK